MGTNASPHSILAALDAALDLVRKEAGNPVIQADAVQMFLRAGQSTVLPMADFEKLGGSQAAVSRNIAMLGIGKKYGEQGAGLVEAFEDPEYRRRKLVRLTPRGRKVLGEVVDIIIKGARRHVT